MQKRLRIWAIKKYNVGFEVLVVVSMKIMVFWVVMPRSSEKA
jgi:hypothetical protein